MSAKDIPSVRSAPDDSVGVHSHTEAARGGEAATFRMLDTYSMPFGWRQYDLENAGKCGYCEAPSPCKCRYCNSCSEYWTSDDNMPDHDDVLGRPRKNCPPCAEWFAAGCPNETIEGMT